jgi:hypothetical protein
VRVFISVDMEGVTGVTDPEDVLPDGADYARGRVFMTGDANAAILGAYDAGATEVLVNDSHWTMRNLLLEQLDPRARMIKGFQKPMCMVQALADRGDRGRVPLERVGQLPVLDMRSAPVQVLQRAGHALADPGRRDLRMQARCDQRFRRTSGSRRTGPHRSVRRDPACRGGP